MIRTEHLPPTDADDRTGRRSRRHDRLTDLVLVVSNDNRDRHLELLGRDPSKLAVLHNGISIPPEPDPATTAEIRDRLALQPGRPVIGSVGRLHDQKGYRYLLDAVALLVEDIGPVNLVIAGEGERRADLEQQARSLRIDDLVRLPGFVDQPADLLGIFDVAVMPSLFEGLALTMLEMMAAARPCVFSDHPSFAEGTDGGRVARLVPVGDAPGIARAIADLLADPDAAARLGAAARQHVTDEFSIERHVGRLMDRYDAVVERRSRTGALTSSARP